MKRSAFGFLLSGMLALFSSCQSVLALDDLFPGKLFPDSKNKETSFFSGFDLEQPPESKKTKQDPEAAKRAYKEMVAADDAQMRSEIERVAGWLQEFSLRNQNRFPGVNRGVGSIDSAAQVQLTELVGPNPYAGTVARIQDQELNGLAPGLAFFYNPDGTPTTANPLANDEWTAELTADNDHRIKLQMDGSASAGAVESLRTSPPTSMQSSPGTIVASGNGQGFFYVWGAGIDGRPVKDADGKSLYIISANTADYVGDQGQEAAN